MAAIRAFCSTCNREVYIGATDTAVCPVCSSPLVEAIQPITADRPADQTGAG